MVISTNLKILRNLEAFQVFSEILTFLNEEESMEEPLKGLRSTLAAHLSAFDTALIPERRSPYTAELARLDAQRDYVFRSFTAQLKLYLSSFDGAQVKAAEALLALVDKYGKNIPSMPYRQETGAIKNLLQDLEGESNVAYAQTLHAEHWIADLRACNDQFDRTMSTRSDVSSEAEMGAAKAARTVVQSDFENFCAVLNALALLNGEAAYKRMADRINQRITESRTSVSRRGSRKKDAVPDTSADTPDSPQPPAVEE